MEQSNQLQKQEELKKYATKRRDELNQKLSKQSLEIENNNVISMIDYAKDRICYDFLEAYINNPEFDDAFKVLFTYLNTMNVNITAFSDDDKFLECVVSYLQTYFKRNNIEDKNIIEILFPQIKHQHKYHYPTETDKIIQFIKQSIIAGDIIFDQEAFVSDLKEIILEKDTPEKKLIDKKQEQQEMSEKQFVNEKDQQILTEKTFQNDNFQKEKDSILIKLYNKYGETIVQVFSNLSNQHKGVISLLETIHKINRKDCDTNEFRIAHLLNILSTMYKQAGEHGGYGGTLNYASNVGSIITYSFYLIAVEMLNSIVPESYKESYNSLKNQFQTINDNAEEFKFLMTVADTNKKWFESLNKEAEELSRYCSNQTTLELLKVIISIYDDSCIEGKAEEMQKKLRISSFSQLLSRKVKIQNHILFKWLLNELPKITRQNLKVSLELMNHLKLDQYIDKLLEEIKNQKDIEEGQIGIDFINSTNIGMMELIFTEERTKSFILDIFTNNNQIPFFNLLLNLNEDKLDLIISKAEKVMNCSHAVQGILRLQSNNAFGTPARLKKLNELYMNVIIKSIKNNNVTDALIDLFEKEDINDTLLEQLKKITKTIINCGDINLFIKCVDKIKNKALEEAVLQELKQPLLNEMIFKILKLGINTLEGSNVAILLLKNLDKQQLGEIMNQITPDIAANNLMFFSQNIDIWQIKALFDDSMNKTIERIKNDKEFRPHIFKNIGKTQIKSFTNLWDQMYKICDIKLIECLNKNYVNFDYVTMVIVKNRIIGKFFDSKKDNIEATMLLKQMLHSPILTCYSFMFKNEQLLVILREMQKVTTDITPDIVIKYIDLLDHYYNEGKQINNEIKHEMEKCYVHFFKMIKSDVNILHITLNKDDLNRFKRLCLMIDKDALSQCLLVTDNNGKSVLDLLIEKFPDKAKEFIENMLPQTDPNKQIMLSKIEKCICLQQQNNKEMKQ